MPLVPHIPPAKAPEHDALVVALDSGDLGGVERERAEALIGSCAGCTALAADLVAIRGAMTALPVPARRRDYRLTEADAARLRPDRWRRLVGWLAAPRSSVRPLATGLAALGIVGLLVSGGLPRLGASSAALDTAGSAAQSPVAAENSAAGGSQETRAPYAPAAVGSAAPAALPSAAPAALPSPAASAPPFEASSAAPFPAASAGPGSGTAGMAGEDTSPTPPDGRYGGPVPGGGAQASDKAAAQVNDDGAGLPPAVLVSAGLLAAGLLLLLARVLAVRRTA